MHHLPSRLQEIGDRALGDVKKPVLQLVSKDSPRTVKKSFCFYAAHLRSG